MKTTTDTTTSHTHEFLPSGCRNQWANDHNQADCWKAFLDFHNAPAGLTITEFYEWIEK